MTPDRFWLTDTQFAKISPHLPTDTRSEPRVDDRRVISGIVHVLESGGRGLMRCARQAAAKGGARAGDWALERRTDDQNPCADRRTMPARRLHVDRRQLADCTADAALLARMPACDRLHGDKGYDSNALRRQIENSRAMPNIPPNANRKWTNCFSPFLYRDRNALERMFCRLKDFRRVAPRYDRSAVNFLSAVCIAATVSYWL